MSAPRRAAGRPKRSGAPCRQPSRSHGGPASATGPSTDCRARSGRRSSSCPLIPRPTCRWSTPRRTARWRRRRRGPRASRPPMRRRADLSQLLSGVLLAFTLDFEAASRISLPISANTLRVLDPTGVRLRDLPRLTGVSREANAMCAGWLERHGCAVAEPDPAATRGKVLRLTTKGRKAQEKCRRILDAVEESWRSSYGPSTVDPLRAALERLVGDGMLALLSAGPWPRSLPGQLACPGPATPGHVAALPDGPPPRGLP